MKVWKIFLAIGVSVLLIGITVFLVGLAMNGWKITVEYETHTYHSTEENTILDLNLSAGEMYVGFYDGDVIEVEYPDSYQYGYTVSENGGTLSVTPRTSFFMWWFGWDKIPAVVVRIPNGKVMELNANISAGKIEVADGEFTSVKTEMSAGWTNLGNLKCGKFVSRLSAGKLDVKGLECTDFDLHLSAGTANVGETKCDRFNVDLSAGSVYLKIAGKQSDYAVSVDKSAGSCNLADQSGADANKRINIDLSAGSVNVTFTD